MNAFRIYADTSVFGGVFDEGFELPSRIFFDQVRQERFHLVISALVRQEIQEAPRHVQTLFQEMEEIAEISDIPGEALDLRDEYLGAGILRRKSMADALHVAAATVLECRAIVSWNFRHIVHFQKVPRYNGVNKANGYTEIAIHTPQEIILYEDEGF